METKTTYYGICPTHAHWTGDSRGCPQCVSNVRITPVTMETEQQKSEGGTKHDEGKPLLALLPVEALVEVGKVMTFGAKKYTAHNWRGGFAYTRVASAALRHLFARISGKDVDEESGLSHLAHAVCCVLFLLTFQLTNTGTDDRYKGGEK